MKNDRDKKILILGGSSYVGTHLLARLGSKGAIATYYKNPIDEGVYFDALTMDLRKIIQEPGALSCALILLGDTDPESCAKDPKRSYALNVDSIKRIIDYLKRNQIKPIFASSEFIFDGKKGGYVEDDEPNPILTYGKQKVEVERYLQKTCNDHIILRFAKIYGSQPDDGTLFTNWISEINKADTIRCASDQIFSSIYIDDLVESIMRIIEGDHTGIFHVAGNKAYARIELLQML
ncbi:MAG: sugar nucleotide-binding protein, partial [Candidatus Omnitrophica bacterium]|nr:sugar nucleotide-binding protein [Candidatus Omnitrophota bacterium]